MVTLLCAALTEARWEIAALAGIAKTAPSAAVLAAIDQAIAAARASDTTNAARESK